MRFENQLKGLGCYSSPALVPGLGESFRKDLSILGRKLLRSQVEGHLGEFAREAERHLVILVVHWRAGVYADVKRFVRRMRNAMVCGIFRLATSLPSTFSRPAPPLAVPGPS